MPSLLESLTEPHHADLVRSQTFLDFLATKLSADDFALATELLWTAIDPIIAARRNRDAA